MHILAVDDDDLTLELLRLSLSRANYFDTAFAGSGRAALDLIETAEAPFDCFLLDVSMPEMDGITLCRRIRALPGHAETPIIMVTRLDHRKYISEAFEAGATDYIVKPFDQAEIGTRIDLAKRRLESQQSGGHASGAPVLVTEDFAKTRQLSHPFDLLNVPNALERATLEDALLDRPSFSRFHICALKIVNIDTIFAERSLQSFRATVSMVGRVLAELLWDEEFELCHLGNGVIGFVLHGASDVVCQDLAIAINDWISDMVTADATEPVVVVASDGPVRYVPKLDRIASLAFAAEIAEDLADAVMLEAETLAMGTMDRAAAF